MECRCLLAPALAALSQKVRPGYAIEAVRRSSCRPSISALFLPLHSQFDICSHRHTCLGFATQSNGEHEGATGPDLPLHQDEPQERRQKQSHHREANDAALRANGIMIHTLQLLKLYLLHCCEVGDELPTLNRQFVTSVMKVLCKPPSQSRHPKADTMIIKDTLKVFYERHYKAYVLEELSYEHMSTVPNYLSTDVITMYENNIKQNYIEYVEQYVNVSWRKKELVAIIRESERNTRSRQDALCARLRSVKDDLLRPHQLKTSHSFYHAWIDEQRDLVLPARDLKTTTSSATSSARRRITSRACCA